MKRLLLVGFLFTVGTLPTFAQTTDPTIVPVTNPTSRAKLVALLADQFEFKVGPEVSSLKGEWKGDLDVTDLDSALKQVLEGSEYKAVIEGKTIHIRKVAATSQLIASQNPPAQMMIKSGAPVQSAIDSIVACSGLKGATLDPGAYIDKLTISSDVPVECNTLSGWQTAIKKVLPREFVYSLDQENILHIRPAKAIAAPAHTAPVVDSTADYVNKLLRGAYGDRYVDELAADRTRRAEQTNGQTRVSPTQIENQVQAPRCEPFGNTQPQSPNGLPAEPGTPYGYNTGYMGNTWNGLPYFIDLAHKDQARRLENVWNTALIKVKGEKHGRNEKFLNKVSVVALVYDSRGCQHQINIIDAGLANNWYEHDVTVPIGADQMVKLIFALEDGSENPQAFGRDQWLQPRAVEKHAKEITVIEEKLTNARSHYNLKTHVFQEDVNGEIKIVSK